MWQFRSICYTFHIKISPCRHGFKSRSPQPSPPLNPHLLTREIIGGRKATIDDLYPTAIDVGDERVIVVTEQIGGT
ncbi:hypothetical protein U1Q18_004043 [Sarracenia purpurea var. burkii]